METEQQQQRAMETGSSVSVVSMSESRTVEQVSSMVNGMPSLPVAASDTNQPAKVLDAMEIFEQTVRVNSFLLKCKHSIASRATSMPEGVSTTINKSNENYFLLSGRLLEIPRRIVSRLSLILFYFFFLSLSRYSFIYKFKVA